MAKKQELNKGLKALLGNIERKNAAEKKEVIKELSQSTALIPIDSIEINPFQPRKSFQESELTDLANSIQSLGLIQPITVRTLGGNQYQIISGERRWRASKLAGLVDIPAYIRIADDQAMMEMALVENIQRTDLNSLEIAFAYKRLLEEFDLTHETVAERVGKNRSTITNYLRLLKLPPTIQQGLKEERLSMGHAKILAGIEQLPLQLQLYQDVLIGGLSVRALEKKIELHQRKISEVTVPGTPQNRDPRVTSIENKLKSYFEANIKINRNTKGVGSIQIQFSSDDELNSILDKIEI
jgi:ParB family chromosome partitioning protein